MWANVQRDGRPAEYRFRPLFNAAVWLTPTTRVPCTCSNAAKRRNPLKFAGLRQTCQRISAASRRKFTILWGHVSRNSVRLFVRLSVRLSVCHMRALWLIQRTYRRYFSSWKGNSSSFLPPNSGWWVPLPSTFNGRSKWPTPSKNRSRRQISACNVSTVRASEKSSIMTNRKSYTGFPTSYRWSA